MHEEEMKGRNEIVRNQQKAYQDCLKRLDNLVRLKTSPENMNGTLITDEEYGRQRFELLKEKARLEELFRDTGHRVEKWLTLAEKTFEFACSARQWFAEGGLEVKKAILSAIGSNLTLRDKILSIEARKPFFIIEQSLSPLIEENRRFEPEKNGSTKGRFDLVKAEMSSGRTLWSSRFPYPNTSLIRNKNVKHAWRTPW